MAEEKTRDERFLDAFMTCWSVFKDCEPAEVVLSAYYKTLEKFSIKEIEKAFSNAIGNLKWFPKPVELIELAEDSHRLLIEDQATIQAALVIHSMKTIGSYGNPNFKDPITIAVVNKGFGGWKDLCENQTSDGNHWFIKNFTDLYQSFNNQDHIEQIEAGPEVKKLTGNIGN